MKPEFVALFYFEIFRNLNFDQTVFTNPSFKGQIYKTTKYRDKLYCNITSHQKINAIDIYFIK